MESSQIDPQAALNIQLWLNGEFDHDTKETIRRLVQEDPQKASDAFYTNLSFSTGGIRGLMGVGTNRMNIYTVRIAAQGLANYMRRQPIPAQGFAVFIGFDSRHHSREFAHEAAKVLAGNGIKVFLCKELRPTPLISFGCRMKKCQAAVMITASHNPPEYNGFKIFWEDGGQVLAPHDTGILQEARKITDLSMIKIASSADHPLISPVGEEIDAFYIEEMSKLQLLPQANRKNGKELKILYTSLHGTGMTLLPKLLASWGFSTLSFIDNQITPDGNFPTTPYPNPENKSALTLGLQKLLIDQFDLLIANDPDADRLGAAVLHKNKTVILTSNQVACLCVEHICKTLASLGKLPKKGAFVKTIVTTDLFTSICHFHKMACFDVLIGFKHIAEKILCWEKDPDGYQFLFGGEDSCGYLLGTLTHDKDGIVAAALLCEIALQAKLQGKTLVDSLHDLYRQYGVFSESTCSLHFEEGQQGKNQMKQKMDFLRTHLPQTINGIEVASVEDYLSSIAIDYINKNKTSITLPASNILIFRLVDHSKLMIRPSGTEPKLKLYCGVTSPPSRFLEEEIISSQEKADQLLNVFKNLISDT